MPDKRLYRVTFFGRLKSRGTGEPSAAWKTSIEAFDVSQAQTRIEDRYVVERDLCITEIQGEDR